MGYHPYTGIKSSHPPLVSRVRRNKVWMTLFSPEAFQVGVHGTSGVGFAVHADKVGNNEAAGKTNKSADSSRWRVQFGC